MHIYSHTHTHISCLLLRNGLSGGQISFFLWSNNFKNIEPSLFDEKITLVQHNEKFYSNIDKRCLDLFLISNCSNHIVIPSSFNWWGAWLSQKKNKIILRPSNKCFSLFKVNNKDLWPLDWIEID